MPTQRLATRPKATRGRSKAKATKKDDETAYTPKRKEQKLTLKFKIPKDLDAPPEINIDGGRKTRGRAAKPTARYAEAMDMLRNGDVDESLDGAPASSCTSNPYHSDDDMLNEMGDLDLEERDMEENALSTSVNLGPRIKAARWVPRDFTNAVHENVIQVYDSLVAQPDIQMELPDFTEPNPDPELRHNEEEDVVKPWTSQDLFHLYILAYSNKKYHICDLVADTWIRQFQVIDAKGRTKIWQENKTTFIRERFANAPRNDNGAPEFSSGAMRFDIGRIHELYENTRDDCGARFIWADAMALCGKGLETQLRKAGEPMDMDDWPDQLMKEICKVTLRAMRIRLTLKIEEPHPEEWCERYHEHPKYNQPCYRRIHYETEAAKAAEAVQGGDAMEVDNGNPNAEKHVTFAE